MYVWLALETWNQGTVHDGKILFLQGYLSCWLVLITKADGGKRTSVPIHAKFIPYNRAFWRMPTLPMRIGREIFAPLAINNECSLKSLRQLFAG